MPVNRAVREQRLEIAEDNNSSLSSSEADTPGKDKDSNIFNRISGTEPPKKAKRKRKRKGGKKGGN